MSYFNAGAIKNRRSSRPILHCCMLNNHIEVLLKRRGGRFGKHHLRYLPPLLQKRSQGPRTSVRDVGPCEFKRNPEERLTDVRLGIGCARGAARLGDAVVLGAGAGCGFPDGCRIADVCNDDGA
ncbi:MAG: hypothetical protein GY839_16710 [candidate division Zixibacteria bacterium]|nr:hypothetical protein [candidate division Zixibacteria bacterium]